MPFLAAEELLPLALPLFVPLLLLVLTEFDLLVVLLDDALLLLLLLLLAVVGFCVELDPPLVLLLVVLMLVFVTLLRALLELLLPEEFVFNILELDEFTLFCDEECCKLFVGSF